MLSTKNIDERLNSYKEWIKEIHVFPSSFYLAMGIISLSLLFFFTSPYVRMATAFLLIKSVAALSFRNGHMEGYLDGYQTAIGDDNDAA